MKIILEKSSGRAICRNRQCNKNPLYISEGGTIKKDTTCVIFIMDSAGGINRSFYCRECVDKIYLDIKTILNPALWSFH
jgi:hypothetical protein